MKSLTILFGALLSVKSLMLAAPTRKQLDDDYRLGVRVGSCIAAKCQIFRGFLATGSPKSGAPILIRVDDWIYGTPITSGFVAVPWEDHLPTGEGANRPSSEWMNLELSGNTAVTIVLGLDHGFGIRPGEAVLVTTNERETGLIRSLAQEAERIESSPILLSAAVASLSDSQKPALAGYLFAHLVLSKKPRQPELTVNLFSQLLTNPGVPEDRWDQIADWMVAEYYALSETGRTAMIRRFTELGRTSEVGAVRAALHGLAKVSRLDDSAKATMAPATLDALSKAYSGLVNKGRISRNQSWESWLGLKYEQTRPE